MGIDLAADYRQRAADVVAVMALTQANLRDSELDLSRLHKLVSTYCAGESPETLKEYSAMSWEKAVRAIKIAFVKHYLASQPAGPNEPPPPSVEQNIGNCLVAAFFKFATYRSINPDWFAPHLAQVRISGCGINGRSP